MSPGPLVAVEALLREAIDSLRGAAHPAATDDDLIDVLRMGARAERELQRVTVETVAALARRGTVAERGQRPDTALSDVLGVERGDARRVVTAAEHVCPRIDLHGQVLPALLPATAVIFHAGAVTLRHIEVIARLLAGPAAQRLDAQVLAAAEAQIAACAADYTPAQLHNWGTDLLTLLDQDGAAPDDREPRRGQRAVVDPQPQR
jgi:5-methylcytosine-specific restriction protein A